MNLVMQFRKVCNHPNLFESPEATSPFLFAPLDWSYLAGKENNHLVTTACNPISFQLPRLVYEEGMAKGKGKGKGEGEGNGKGKGKGKRKRKRKRKGKGKGKGRGRGREKRGVDGGINLF
jgi:hypothetical protein